MSATRYWRLNYEISDWLPKNSIWYKETNGDWERADKQHSIGGADYVEVYWFAVMLEQESNNPSNIRDKNNKHILSEVEKRTDWFEI